MEHKFTPQEFDVLSLWIQERTANLRWLMDMQKKNPDSDRKITIDKLMVEIPLMFELLKKLIP